MSTRITCKSQHVGHIHAGMTQTAIADNITFMVQPVDNKEFDNKWVADLTVQVQYSRIRKRGAHRLAERDSSFFWDWPSV